MKIFTNVRSKLPLLAASFAFVVGAGLVAAPQTHAVGDILDGAGIARSSDDQPRSIEQSVTDITNVLLFALGAVSVIMIVVGGFRFATSNGNAEQIKQAKNIILYAVAGLVVAIMAYAIVNFVVRAFAN